MNWIKWHLTVEPLSQQASASLAVQARHLRNRLEHHILGNHLLANAKALYLAGAYFSGREAHIWLSLGRRLLERQLQEQILDDGAHFELSPMYHLIVLEDLLDVVNIGRAYDLPLPSGIEGAVEKMLAWSRVMRHPDGDIPFFNDATLGIAPAPAELDAYGVRLDLAPATTPDPAAMMSASGYVRLQAQDAVLFADLAAVGPSYLPGHAHADTLSFELSIGGERVFVNGGTSVYGLSAERGRQRGTAAHTTLSIDGVNSSDVWAGFRVGRRASPQLLAYTKGEPTILAAEHDGYVHRPGAPRHKRQWELDARFLAVTDTVSGSGVHLLEAFYHLHPDIKPEDTSNGLSLRLSYGRLMTVVVPSDCQAELIPSTWHPGFGIALPSHALRVSRNVALPASVHVSFHWDV
ncbi:heparinase II/III family protein [Devosia limi]|uniref:heparinase II/III family protein n=1 Tax=Devosia limi TaxID=288995 RepID=UPI001AEBFB96|nr:alginate lyase family protein [Devosia limi]